MEVGVRRFLAILIFATIVSLTLAACGFTPTPHLPAVSSYDTPTPYTPYPGETPLSTLTPTAWAPSITPTQPTATPEDCTPDSEFVADITIPDGTLIKPGDSFVKTWRIRNNGGCTWNREYTWEQVNAADNRLTALETVSPLAGEVPPGETVDISVLMVLHEAAELGSTQIARFQLRSPSGKYFGERLYAKVYAVNGSGRCPNSTADLLVYFNLDDRYCFLYPQTHETEAGQNGTIYVRLPAPSGSTEESLLGVSIQNHGDTGGLSLAAWADQQIEAAQDPDHPAKKELIWLTPLTAYATVDLPGLSSALHVYLVYAGNGFEIVVMPLDGSCGAETLELWEIIRTSFVFYAP
jgi:hypothetical protein